MTPSVDCLARLLVVYPFLAALPVPLAQRLRTEALVRRLPPDERLFADRLADMMALIESVAFRRLDQRLAARLRERTTPETT